MVKAPLDESDDGNGISSSGVGLSGGVTLSLTVYNSTVMPFSSALGSACAAKSY
jgi:hypothetical protein